MNTPETRQVFERRLLVLQLFGLLLPLLLTARLVDLQWIRHQGLLRQAEHNRVNIVPVPPTRGEIVDRHGQGLAVNRISWRLTLIPERVEHPDKLLEQLRPWLGWSKTRLERLRQRIRRFRPDRPVLLADKLTWQQAAPIAARLHEMPGLDVRVGTHRFYPFGTLTSHVIGYLSLAGPEDVRAGVLPTEKVGRSGAERLFESELHGKPGAQYEEVDAHGRRVDVFKRVPPVMGRRVRLALDVNLQEAASRALGDRVGAVVALDVNTGGILALLSKPGFEPNRFITGLEAEQWRAWVTDPRHPLLNRALQAAYPPASTFKLLVGLAGLRRNAPLALGATQCPGFLQLADRKLRCWKRIGHGRVTLHKAIVQSCDVYFYELGDQLGMPAIGEEAAQWGFGQRTGIRLGPEATGVIPGPKKRAGRRWRRWFRGETMITSIGQGQVAATPLQLARFVAAIANGGRLLVPHLAADAEPQVARVLDVNPAHLDIIRRAMRDVVADVHGTAHAAMRGVPWTVAGKTGTAQVVAKAQDVKGSDAKTLSYLHRDHAWFVGFAPYEHPRIAFAVFVEHGGHGGSAAAPVAAALIRAAAAEENRAMQTPTAEADAR